MLKIGITGQAGFIGTHLFNYLGLNPSTVTRIPFKDEFFVNTRHLEDFVSSCDVIVHLAGINRHNEPDYIFQMNILLTQLLISALEKTKSTPHVIFSSSSQEETGTIYGKAKAECRRLFIDWAEKNNSRFTGLVIANVFGPFGNPFYNSVIATFSYQLTHDQTPHIDIDKKVNLIYVSNLVKKITEVIETRFYAGYVKVNHDIEKNVSEILEILLNYKELYYKKQIFPSLNDPFEVGLFNTFRSYIDPKTYFPARLVKNEDNRGMFVETIKLHQGGQVSFSTTKPGITRGNHFHTRKIERFAVLKGNAKIRLRRIGTDEVLDFFLSGSEPSYVDMPVWYTHNIQNIGDNELYNLFWINEFYDPGDTDTWFENV